MLKDLDIDLLERHPQQRLKPLRPQDLLAVNEVGFAEPVLVRPLPYANGETHYQILRGERWWRIAGLLGLSMVPVIIRATISDQEAMAIAMSEDTGPEDPISAALALKNLLVDKRISITRLAGDLGRTRTALSHSLRLLKLAEPVQTLVQQGEICPGVARALVTLPPSLQIQLAREAIAQRLSARAVELRAKKLRDLQSEQSPLSQAAPALKNNSDTTHLERQLSDLLGCSVQLDDGKLIIQYHDLEILDGVLERLGYIAKEEWD